MPLPLIRHNVLSLVKQGFNREEILWMPISEMFDYIQLINQQIEEEQNSVSTPMEKPENPTLSDVFRGSINF